MPLNKFQLNPTNDSEGDVENVESLCRADEGQQTTANNWLNAHKTNGRLCNVTVPKF